MKIYENEKYINDLATVAKIDLPWEKLKNTSILLSGASGLIGSCLVDTVMLLNRREKLNCMVYALGRNKESAKNRFAYCWEDELFHFISHDINSPLEVRDIEKVDYVLHLASNTHPVAYSTDPIGTVTTNIIGTRNMLEFAVAHQARRFCFSSTVEVYGENRGDVELFDENYCGYINCNTLRAGYPESKRCGEALCQAYIKQKGLDIVIPRLPRTYGPTMLMTDTKASSQFILKALSGENIVLKSDGMQYFSYIYVVDAVTALLTILLKGQSGEAYNISDANSDVRLKDLAGMVAKVAGKEVIFDLPNSTEKAGYSNATKARLNSTKLKNLGWSAKTNIEEGIKKTIEQLKDQSK